MVTLTNNGDSRWQPMNNAQKKNKEKADCTDKKYKYSQLKSFFKQIAKENYKNISIFKKAVY